ncbi:hypothetical protein U14_04387 [Candidatus Moduliflexus flocculans]|uniref:PIN domain-containing protein n=1 Tax=Candidatus Moduliflexus flocculans TaxID=1499966 RepID=A0A0S6W0G5_9BACT|nr:hypothetical protein U14_04387 [Candidatus Moduliflexus flocculans]
MKKTRIYIETSIVSYLTARMSRDLIVAARQQITQEWWDNHQSKFEVYISELVMQEAGIGDADAVQRRLGVIAAMPRLQVNAHVIALAKQIVRDHALPSKAIADATHIALAVVHQMEYLLTWNCKHIANAQLQKGIWSVIQQQGYPIPILCTPEELMGV